MIFKKGLLFAFCFFVAVSALLSYQLSGMSTAPNQTTSNDDKSKNEANIQANYDYWKGLGFGLGYSLSIPLNHKINDGYEIVNSVLNVTSERWAIASIVLESHYFFPLRRDGEIKFKDTLIKTMSAYLEKIGDFKASDQEKEDARKKYILADEAFQEIKGRRTIGMGPFLCIIPGTENLLKAIGVGGMVGFRRGLTSNSLNFGIGIVAYSAMNFLVDGINDKDSIANGYKPVKSGVVWGPLFISSFSF